MTPRQRRRQQKVRRILDTAESIVLHDGLDGLTIHALARALDYTPGALYRYFESKQGILAALNSRAVQSYRRVFDAVAEVAADETTGDEADAHLLPLLGTAEAFVRWSQLKPGTFALVSATSADPRDLLTKDEAVHIPQMVSLIGAIGDAIQGAVDARSLGPGDPQQRAMALIFGMIGILQLRKLIRFTPLLTPEPIALGLARDQLVGWGATSERLDRLAAPCERVVEAAIARALETQPPAEPAD